MLIALTTEFCTSVCQDSQKPDLLSFSIRPAKYILPLVKKLLVDGFCLHHLRGWGPPISGQELRHGFLRMVFQPCTLFRRLPALRWPLCPCLFLRRAETLLTAARQHSFELLQLFLQSLQLRVLGLVQRKQGIVFLGDLCVHVPKVQYPYGFYAVFWYLFLRFMALDSIPSPIAPAPFSSRFNQWRSKCTAMPDAAQNSRTL